MSSGKFFIRSGWQWEYWQEAWGGKWGKVIGRVPGVWLCVRGQGTAQNAPPIYPYEPPNKPLARPHLLVPAVPADEDLDGVLGDSRGGSWGLCLTHLWKGEKTLQLFTFFSRQQHIAGFLESWQWYEVEKGLIKCCLSRAPKAHWGSAGSVCRVAQGGRRLARKAK